MLPTAAIVRVIDDTLLFDPASYERCYAVGTARPLEPGHYIVVWPDDIDAPGYDDRPTFVGPHVTRDEARIFLVRHADSPIPD